MIKSAWVHWNQTDNINAHEWRSHTDLGTAFQVIKFEVVEKPTEDLIPGFVGKGFVFDIPAYSELTGKTRAAYDRLRVDLQRHGLKSPLITFGDRVLVGMRRLEILRDSRESFPCISILEDVAAWTVDDLVRLEALKSHIYPVGWEEFQG